MNSKKEKRHEELSAKIFKMGEALMKEGDNKKDMVITNTGNFMILISGIMYDEEDINLFGELCSMFSAKKLLESQEALGPLSNMSEDEIFRTINRLRDEINRDLDEDDDNDE